MKYLTGRLWPPVRGRTALVALVAACLAAVTATTIAAAPASAATSTLATATTRTCAASTPISQRPTVGFGDRGSCVKVAQQQLNAHGARLTTDGVFGPATRSATLSFQRSVRLYADAVIGPNTWAALYGPSGSSNPPPPSTSYNKYRGPNFTDNVVWSFDDCPNNLTKLKNGLAWLDANNVGAWFFVTGDCVQSFKSRYGIDIGRVIRSHGQLVGNHSISHPQLTLLSYAGMKYQLGAPGVVTNYGRPPYGAVNATVNSAYAAVGMREVLWTIDTRDWTGKTAAQVISYVTGQSRPGDTVLMHLTWNGFLPSSMSGMKSGLAARGMRPCRKLYSGTAPLLWPASACW